MQAEAHLLENKFLITYAETEIDFKAYYVAYTTVLFKLYKARQLEKSIFNSP